MSTKKPWDFESDVVQQFGPGALVRAEGATRQMADGSFVVPANHLWVLLLCMIRYSLGRMSYAPGECVEYYGKYKAALTADQKRQIAREVGQELMRHGEHRQDAFPCRADWNTLVETITKDLQSPT
jgi:hypothetical protein